MFVTWQMTQSGLPELAGAQDLKYVYDALQPQSTDTEATIFFTRYSLVVVNFRCILSFDSNALTFFLVSYSGWLSPVLAV